MSTLGKLDCHGLSDVGRVRASNEDQFLIADVSKALLVHETSLAVEDHSRLFGSTQGQLLLVADGMGGQAAGKHAATLAVDTIIEYVLNSMHCFYHLRGSQDESTLVDDLQTALTKCSARVRADVRMNPSHQGMGTTLTLGYVTWPRFYCVHVGDSRCYLFRDGRLRQVTTDHTVAQQLVERGAMTPEQADESRWSHVLWNAIGDNSGKVAPDIYKEKLRIGDTLLLCTDGLSGYLSENEIVEILRRNESARAACEQLVAAANDAGGKDNITVIVARFQDLDQALHAESRSEQVADTVTDHAVGAAAAA
jgi:protein phosphatase